jgi:hypothetical protein
MSPRRHLFAGGTLFAFALGWNAIVHLGVLADVNASVQHLRRPDFADKLWLSLLLTAGIIALFLAGHARFTRGGTLRQSALYGLWFGCVAGLLVDLNQYLLYPLPARVAALWFVSGLLEFTVYGLLAGRILRPPSTARSHPG